MAHRGMPIREVDGFNTESLRGKKSDIISTPAILGRKFVLGVLALVALGMIFGIGH